MKKRIIQFFAILITCFFVLPLATQKVSAADVWDGSTKTEITPDGDGVYKISNGAELAWFAESAPANCTAVLTADIDLGGNAWVGKAGFSGSFDGKSHTVSGISGATGLFTSVIGTASAHAVVKNVTVNGTISGKVQTGGIANQAYYADFTNCTNLASVTGTSTSQQFDGTGGIVGVASKNANPKSGTGVGHVTITDCINKGEIKSKGVVGGIFGYAQTAVVVNRCYNTGAITASQAASHAGGIGGYAQGYNTKTEIKNCYNQGSVTGKQSTGGIIGSLYNDAVLTNCYNSGAVSGTSGKIGGIAGNVYNTKGVASNCYYLETSPVAATGKTGSIQATKVSSDELKSDKIAQDLGDEYVKAKDDYPVFKNNSVATYNVTKQQSEAFVISGDDSVDEGNDYEFSVTVKSGYYKADDFKAYVNGTAASLNSENKYVVTAVSENLTITVTGVKKTYTVNLSDWTYGETANTPSVTDYSGDGAIIYTYYIDSTLQTKTSSEKGGAASEGEVPVNSGTYFVEAQIAETANYLGGSGSTSFTIEKAPLTADLFDFEAPADLTFDGSSKTAAVTPKSNLNGVGAVTVKYYQSGSLVTETNEAKTYQVKIDVAEGDNYLSGSDLTADTWTFTVVQKATVTFKVVNGTWNDGSSKDVTVILSGSDGASLMLSEADIPETGKKPDENYKEGSWDTVPDTSTEITGDVTYTYTYAEDVIYTVSGDLGVTYTIGSGKNLTYTVKRNIGDTNTFALYNGATMDGNAIPENATETKAGSLILTIKSSYLDTLSEGEHKLSIVFRDGKIDTTLTVEAAKSDPATTPETTVTTTPAATPETTVTSTPAATPGTTVTSAPKPTLVPKTGDNGVSNISTGLLLLGIAAVIVFAIPAFNRRKNDR